MANSILSKASSWKGKKEKSMVYDKIHVARFGEAAKDISPLEFVPPLSELCLRAAALHFNNRPTFAGVPERVRPPPLCIAQCA